MKSPFLITRKRLVLVIGVVLSLLAILVIAVTMPYSTVFRKWMFGTRSKFPPIASIAHVTFEPDGRKLRIVRMITRRETMEQAVAGLQQARWFKWPYLTTDDVGDWYLCLNSQTDVVVCLEFIPPSEKLQVPKLMDLLGILKSSGTVQLRHDVAKTPSGFCLMPLEEKYTIPYLTDWPEFGTLVSSTVKE